VDTWPAGRGATPLDEVIASIEVWLRNADGVTISGGEPFDQPDALRALLVEVKARSSADILVYSGYGFDQLAAAISKLDGLIDALISEPFILGAPQTLPLRGSDNQQLHCLTALGTRRFTSFHDPAQQESRTLDLMFDEDGTAWLAGIPRQDDWARLTLLLAEEGHEARTSQAPRRRIGARR
jgi:anaerobic ribonucleoside-triphosphate reductase activating protein